MQKISVIKRSGEKEEYSEEKIIKVAKAASVNEEDAQKLAKAITKWLKETKKKEVSSLTLGQKMIDELKEIDLYAANMFSWYQKTKEK